MNDWIPEPLIIMVGCQAWPPKPLPDGSCPVCGSGVRPEHATYYCAVCDSLPPRVEAKVRAARIGLKRKDKVEAAEKGARAKLSRTPVLSESDRRKLWNGYRGNLLAEFEGKLPNFAKEGRDWLTAIGQVPDWTLTLDRRGRVTGRTYGLPPES